MKNKLPCELVQDLFPSYIDGLTSKVTNEIIEEHVEDCGQCKNVLMEMKDELAEPIKVEEKEEIDFLKKTRKKTRKTILQWAVVYVTVIVIWVIANWYFIGQYVSSSVDCQVRVEGNQVLVEASMKNDDSRVISKVKYEEKDGVIYLSFKAVLKSPFHQDAVIRSRYEAAEPFKEVSCGKQIYWYDGEPVTEIASNVYNTKHNYVGDMSANGETTRALNMGEVLGSFKNELQTSEEPYGWKMILENEITAEDRNAKERIMKAYAYILLAAVGNLGEVSYEYRVDGETQIITITEEDATKFAGRDIKECGENILLFQELIEDAKIYGRLYTVELE